MSLKTTIRRYLPPTERNFEDKIKHLEHQINDILSECRELHIANENLYNQLEATKRYMQLRQATSYYESAVCRASSNISDNRILLAGWYGERNFGDELMLRTVLSHIPEESIRNVTIMLWPDLNYPRFCLDHRINIVHWPNTLWELDAIANSFDALVWGGGAIIDDKQFSDDYFNINVGNIYIKLSELMIARGKKVYSLALSANRTLNNREYITSLKRIVENSALFSVRDPYTAGLLRTFGIDSNSIVQTEDIVFASEELFNSGRAESNQINLVAISPLCYKHRPEEYVAVVNAACEVFHELNSSCRICLIPLRGIDNTDVQFCESLREMLYHPEWVDVACYPADLTDSELFRCDFHISYKYHAALIADVLQIPGLTVLDETHPHYGNKMTHLSELFAYKDGLVTAHELKKKPVDYIKSHALSGKMPTCPPDLHQFESQWLLDACKRIADCD